MRLKAVMSSVFELQTAFKVEYAPASIKKWRSKRTGLELTLVDQASPIVNGYFAVTTEILNDSGCPHTLEHLIFMGSKKYPYKGLLDILGNLAFSVTNAWTATDQTVYTLTTAGWEGFRMLLPIYLDHVLYPTLTDAACYTEVHHIDSDAKDKGVVYSEMQAIENQSYFIEGLEAQRTLYKKSGYKSETGGLTENLRTLQNDTIRKYHADNYRPDNLCVIITGTVDETELLQVMTQFDSQLDPLPEVPSRRPFVDTPHDEPLTKTVVRHVEFPDEDESAGEIQISWIGPNGKDIVLEQAMDILGRYFTSSAVSLFSREFIEVDHPLATASDFYMDSFLRVGFNLNFNNVPTESIDSLPQKVIKLLEDHCNEDDFDMVRIKDLVTQTRQKFVFAAEKSPDAMSNTAIFEFSYGDASGSDLKLWLETLTEYDELMSWDAKKWLEVYKKFFLDNKPCIVTAKASSKLYHQIKEENKKLIEDRKISLGENGLKELDRRLEQAQEANNRPIPKKIFEEFGQPDPAKINFIKTQSIGAGLNHDVTNDDSKITKSILQDQPKDFPLYVHMENIESNFATIHLLFSSFEVDKKYLPYLQVFRTLLTLPVENSDGSLTPYEDVVKQIRRDTIDFSFGNSFLGTFPEFIDFKITVENEKYDKAIEWYTKLMFHTKFTEQRVLVALKKLIKSLPEVKRSGSSMLYSVQNKVSYTERSLMRALDAFANEAFLKDLLERIDNGEFAKVEKVLEKIRSQLFQLSNTRAVILMDANRLTKPLSSWTPFITEARRSIKQKTTTLYEVPKSSSVLSKAGYEKKHKCYVITTPGSDSSYMTIQTAIPFDPLCEDAFKIALGSEYLQCVEGPFWKAIRGNGLAYGANMSRNSELGKLAFMIYRGADVEKCFDAAKKLVEDFANGVTPIEEKMRLGAISSLVNSLTNSQSNYFEAAGRKFYDNVLAKRGPDYNRRLMETLTKITAEDLVQVFKRYFVKVFDPAHSICFVSCNPSQGDGIVSHFKKAGYEVSLEEVKAEEVDEDDDASMTSDEESWEQIDKSECP